MRKPHAFPRKIHPVHKDGTVYQEKGEAGGGGDEDGSDAAVRGARRRPHGCRGPGPVRAGVPGTTSSHFIRYINP